MILNGLWACRASSEFHVSGSLTLSGRELVWLRFPCLQPCPSANACFYHLAVLVADPYPPHLTHMHIPMAYQYLSCRAQLLGCRFFQVLGQAPWFIFLLVLHVTNSCVYYYIVFQAFIYFFCSTVVLYIHEYFRFFVFEIKES